MKKQEDELSKYVDNQGGSNGKLSDEVVNKPRIDDEPQKLNKSNHSKRLDWKTYFMAQAVLISQRSTCDRAHVGAILTKDNRILASGYNGSLQGQPHCDTDGHLLVNDHCVRTVHAEQNAIIQCARAGVSTVGSTLYVTHFPCINCTKLLIQAGIHDIMYLNDYNNNSIESTISINMLSQANVTWIKLHLNSTFLHSIIDTFKGEVDNDS